jgi:hypothetical protein
MRGWKRTSGHAAPDPVAPYTHSGGSDKELHFRSGADAMVINIHFFGSPNVE